MDTIEPQVEVKPCIKCGARDRSVRGQCRPCHRRFSRKWHEENKERAREYREENKERIRETSRKWYEENKERIREYREENKERIRETRRKRYEENKERMREASRKWYEENKERARETSRKWYEENKERAREYREENKERIREYRHNRRARKKNPNYPDDRLSRGLKKKLMKLQGGKCAYANAPLAHWCAVDIKKENHMDHIVPLAPPHNGRNIDSNMQLTCPACNLHKSSKCPTDFAREVGMIL